MRAPRRTRRTHNWLLC